MSIDLPGFADPVLDAQAAFRATLDAMARPGTTHRVGVGLSPPAPLGTAAASVLLTLVDVDTPLWIAPTFLLCNDWLAFHCGAPIAGLSSARFIVTAELPNLAGLAAGSDEAPEESATIVLQVSSIGVDGAHARRLRLAGPGLRTPTMLAVGGLPDDFVARWAGNHALLPRGVDIILCAGSTLAALPRTLVIAEG
jgi:alpha-D-ribose 1-methylphosphonate 5-triphosphate synthase subunit PhnH